MNTLIALNIPLKPLMLSAALTFCLLVGVSKGSFAAETDLTRQANAQSLNLDLPQAILLALSNNYQLKINQFNPEAANKNTLIAKGGFEPNFFTRYSQQNNEVDGFSSGVTLATTSRRSELGIEGALYWGTQYRLALQANSIDSNSGEASASAGPAIEIIQPLLKGFGRDSAYAQVRLAKQQQQIAQYDFQLDLQQLIQDVTNTYIDFHLAVENLKIAQLNWQLAKKTLDDEQQRFELGRNAASDLFRPHSTYALRHDAVLRAQRTLKYQETILKSLIFSDEDDLLALTIVSAGLPEVNLLSTNVKKDYLTALKKRPEYQIAKISMQSNKTQLNKDSRDKLPQLDLVVRYQNSGLSEQRTIASAYDNYGQFNNEQNYIGLNFSVPITNGVARNKQAISKIRVKQSELHIKQLERQIISELDFAAFNVHNNWQQIASAENAVVLAEKTLASEEEKMSVGRSSSFFVLNQQSQLAVAKVQQTNAVASYLKSIVEYQRQTGTLLTHYGIEPQKYL